MTFCREFFLNTIIALISIYNAHGLFQNSQKPISCQSCHSKLLLSNGFTATVDANRMAVFTTPIKYTAAAFEPGDLEDDKELEKSMAEELYNGLKKSNQLLLVEEFLEWDDIKDVLSRGFVDGDTMQVIFSEAGVTNGVMTFDQFYEVVDLVNQVSMALEDSGDFLTDEDDDDEEMRLDSNEFFGL
mmetsp:Transcript_8705/g.12970  ORF Transcript_8705/g.12970 Transcript_8705/m.12970 type:complete len:186 (+) Transcript_8705:1229-1786(+)